MTITLTESKELDSFLGIVMGSNHTASMNFISNEHYVCLYLTQTLRQQTTYAYRYPLESTMKSTMMSRGFTIVTASIGHTNICCPNAQHWINLIRNPLSTRNPGVSLCQFETPPPSTFKCCLAMFSETHVRDCLSTCRAPAICPGALPCITSSFTTIIMSPTVKVHPSSVYAMTVWPQLWYSPLGSSPLTTLCGLVEDTGHRLCTSESWVQPECRRPFLLLVWSVHSNRVAGHHLCTSESWVQPECKRPCLSDDRGGRWPPSRWRSWYSCMTCR